MVGWRQTGLVPDSEDEGFSDSISTSPSSSSASPPQDTNDVARSRTESLSQANRKAQNVKAKLSGPQSISNLQKDLSGKNPTGNNASATIPNDSDSPADEQIDELQADFEPAKTSANVSSLFSRQGNLEPAPLDLPLNDDSDSESALSSPLSLSPPGSPRLSSPILNRNSGDDRNRQHVEVIIQNDRQQNTQQGHAREEAMDQMAMLEQLEQLEAERGGRTFRKRRPIQLHPYLLEGEKYRQTMKMRGVKPVHTTTLGGHRQPEITHDESQNQDEDYEGEEEPESPVRGRRIETLAASSPSMGPHQNHEPFGDVNSDDDLPPLEDILSRKIVVGRQSSNKRRKTYSRREQIARVAQNRARHPQAHDASNIFEIPASPSTSADMPPHSTTTFKKKKLKLPKPISPIALPTPATSSEPRPPPRNIVLSDSDSDIPPRGTFRQRLRRGPRSSASEDSNSDSNSSSPASQKSAELKRIRKRMKGVLPASWLRLDQQAQVQKERERARQTPQSITPRSEPEHNEDIQLRSSTTNQGYEPASRGAALSGVDIGDGALQNHQTLAYDIANLFDDDDDDEFPRDGTMMDNLDDDIPEYDRIDYMQPGRSKPRQGRKTSAGRKRQMKLDDLGVARKRPRLNEPGTGRKRNVSGNTGRGQKVQSTFKPLKSRRTNAPRLSIIDAQQEWSKENQPIPQFIRLAMRQARRQPNEGRHSPTSKHIRLQTQADTDEANDVLRTWRSGTLKPARSGRPLGLTRRQPLIDRVNNSQGIRFPSPVKSTLGYERLAAEPSPDGDVMRIDQSEITIDDNLPETRTTTTATRKPRKTKPSLKLKTSRMPTKPQPFRKAQLEDLEDHFDNKHRAAAFRKQLRRADSNFQNHSDLGHGWVNPQLQLYLTSNETPSQPSANPVGTLAKATVNPHEGKQRKPRKQKPRRLDVNVRDFRQPIDALPSPKSVHDIEVLPANASNKVLLGLGGYGCRYSTSFDVLPLEIGTFFHRTTLIGSGTLYKSFELRCRDLDTQAGFSNVEYGDRLYRWGPWDESIASELASVFRSISVEISRLFDSDISSTEAVSDGIFFRKVSSFLDSLVRYVSESLCFTDPIDRSSFLTTIVEAMTQVFEDLEIYRIRHNDHQRSIKSTVLLLVLTAQAIHISNYPSVDGKTVAESQTLFGKLSRALAAEILEHGVGSLRNYLEENRRLSQREAGIREQNIYVEATVALMHTCRETDVFKNSFWELIGAHLSARISSTNKITDMESAWYDIYTLLPYTEFDDQGVLRTGYRFQSSTEHWGAVVLLVKRLFELYPETAKGEAMALNYYVRVVLERCFNLVHAWGWRRCEPVLNVIFDFFAGNELNHLQREERRGSPRFLDDLHQNPSLEVLPEDRAFHIFLKMLGSGLRSMRDVYLPKKIQGIAWRFIPNHGRASSKEMSVKQEDLDALRNHHDLLCVLYWALPVGHRPRVDLLRNLVDHTVSHREACRLNVRSWSLLLRFQMSTDEPLTNLEPLALWGKEMIEHTISQYRLARAEAEKQFEEGLAKGESSISKEMLESIIKSNQIQVLATLNDLIGGINSALKISCAESTNTVLLRDSGLVDVLRIFDPKQSRTDTVVTEALRILGDYLRRFNKPHADVVQQTSEESQDYGDFPELDDIDMDFTSEPVAAKNDPLQFLQDPLWHFLSNSFGAENHSSDAVLSRTVDVWAELAYHNVKNQGKQWSTYLDAYSPVSWKQLRDTKQTRMFTPYFMAAILERDSPMYRQHQDEFRTAWLLSLVERESMLRFQHLLTAALLNNNTHDPLCHNLPFSRGLRKGAYDMTLSQLRERRLPLISSILQNMRDSLAVARYTREDADNIRRKYTALLKQLMGAMRQNYDDLQHQGSSVRGAYVAFVQKVIEFVQQYAAADICPVDPFFTDSSAFPLPSKDPTYVVGALKGYEPKLSDPKALKQLSMFFQTVSQRAAADGQQTYLVNQLYSAMASIYESGDQFTPTLRTILLEAIFPCYIEPALRSPTGWILARPILRASARIFRESLTSFSATNTNSLTKITQLLERTLALLCQTVQVTIDHVGLLEEAYILSTLADIFRLSTAMLPTLDYLIRRCGDAFVPISPKAVAFFYDLGAFVTGQITKNLDIAAPEPPDLPDVTQTTQATPISQTLEEIRSFASRELSRTLTDCWTRVGERYYLAPSANSNMRREVTVELEPMSEERGALLVAIQEFRQLFKKMPGLVGVLSPATGLSCQDGIDLYFNYAHQDEASDGLDLGLEQLMI